MTRAAAALLMLSLSGLLAQKPGDPSPEPPPPEPISLTIVGKREVTVDRGGRTWDDFKKAVLGGAPPASAPACSLSLKITNNTKETVRVRVTGTAPALTLTLDGKAGAHSWTSAAGAGKMGVTYEELKPGASHTIPLATLTGFQSRTHTHLVPLGEGEYTLKAAYRTYIYTGEAKAKAKGKGIAVGAAFKGTNPHTLTSAPFKLAVIGK